MLVNTKKKFHCLEIKKNHNVNYFVVLKTWNNNKKFYLTKKNQIEQSFDISSWNVHKIVRNLWNVWLVSLSPLFTHILHWSRSPLAFPCFHSRKELSDVFLFDNLNKIEIFLIKKTFRIENVVVCYLNLFTIQLKFNICVVSTHTYIKGPFLLPFHFLQTSSGSLSTQTLDH